MNIPDSKRKKALIIIDVQKAFLNKRNKYVLKNISRLIKRYPYNLYVEAVFHAEKGSIWDKEVGWICPEGKETITIKEINDLLENKPLVRLEKVTKSVFKGNVNLLKILKDKKITEVHIVGLQTNDCVLASAYEAFDLGFFTYVIEECCESGTLAEHKSGLKALREQEITNNSSNSASFKKIK